MARGNRQALFPSEPDDGDGLGFVECGHDHRAVVSSDRDRRVVVVSTRPTAPDRAGAAGNGTIAFLFYLWIATRAAS